MSEQDLKQYRNLKAGVYAKDTGVLLTDLVSVVCFLIELRTTMPGMALHRMV